MHANPAKFHWFLNWVSHVVRPLVLVTLAIITALSLHGCLPPDWSFCECDFRDNYWNHIINDIHMLWSVDDFQRQARDNTTFIGKYLQGPIPDLIDCPMQADSFWKGWPRFGMTRGLIEGSMGDLWMPAARDRIKGVCMSGHVGLLLICANHFLVKSARAGEMEDGGAQMKWLEAAYSHMISIRNMGQPYQIRNCMGQEGFPMNVGAMHAWTVKWLGPENVGTNPVAAYMGGKLDPYQMLFELKMSFTPKTHKDALPQRRPCVPFKEPKCWKRQSKLLIETCEYCCSPFTNKGGRGNPWCWDAEWTYERCCNTDFQDLVCEIKRKGEEGGCVDCKKSVMYVCLTPEEKNLQDTQDTYNKKVDYFNKLQTDATNLRGDIAKAQNDLQYKDGVYREKHAIYNKELNIWTTTMSNKTRISAEGRLNQQNLSWNLSAEALARTREALKLAQDKLSSATSTMRNAEREETEAKQAVARNETEHAAANASLMQKQSDLEATTTGLRTAEAAHAAAQEEALQLASFESAALDRSVTANATQLETYAATAVNLSDCMVAERMAKLVAEAAKVAKEQAEAIAEEAKTARAAAQSAERIAAAAVEEAVRNETALARLAEMAKQVDGDKEIERKRHQDEVEALIRKQASVHSTLMELVHTGKEALRCLIDRTPANATARPQRLLLPHAEEPAAPSGTASTGVTTVTQVCTPPAVVEDLNAFCRQWAEEGMCTQNAEYMRKACPKSCAGKPGVPAPAPVCGASHVEKQAEIPEAMSIEELKQLVANLTAGELSNASSDQVSVELLDDNADAKRGEVAAAEAWLLETRAKERNATYRVPEAERQVEEADRKKEQARAAYEAAQLANASAASKVTEEEDVARLWEAYERDNASAVQNSSEALQERQDDLRANHAAMEQAITLVDRLQKAKKLAEDSVKQKSIAVERASKRLDVLGNNIHTLNTSISENVTTVVAEWLEAQEAEEAAAKRDQGSMFGWTRQFIRKAKKALVDLVASVEAFLDAYVMDMTDKESAVELIRALEEHKAAKQTLRDLDASLKNATAKVTKFGQSVKKAEEIRDKSIETANLTGTLVLEAKHALQIAQDNLNTTRVGLAAATKQLKAAEDALNRTSAHADQAELALEQADRATLDRRNDFRKSQEELEVAQSVVSRAGYAVELAEAALLDAISDALEDWHEKLRRHCGAQSLEFQVYLREQPLLGLIGAAVTGRNLVLQRAQADREDAKASRLAAEAALKEANATTAAARKNHTDHQRKAAAKEEHHRLKEADLVNRTSDLVEAQENWRLAEVKVANVLTVRHEVLSASSTEAEIHRRAKSASEDAVTRLARRTEDLRNAVALVRQREDEVTAAEIHEAKLQQAVEAAKLWLADFVAALLLPEKQKALDTATTEEGQRRKAEEKAALYENWQKRRLNTHIEFMALVNRQNFVQEKDEARAKAKKEYQDAEAALLAAQEKLEKLITDETDTNKKIHETYELLQKLLQEHEDAKEAYNKQDPKDRERSFSTKLEGSGPDAGDGVDLPR